MTTSSSVARAAPLPRAEPLLGHARILANDPLRVLVRWMEDHGPVVRFRVGSREAHAVFGPDAIHRVLSDPDGIYGKQTHGYETLRLFLGDGLLTSEGPRWLERRRILQPAFHRHGVARQMTLMQEVAARWIDRLAREPGPVRIDHVTMEVTLQIVTRALFGADLQGRAHEVAHAMTHLQTSANERITSAITLPFWVPTPDHLRIRRARSRLRRLLQRLVDTRRLRRGEPDVPDALDMLLAARTDTGAPLGDEAILDELVTLLVAGHESTATTLAWALMLLAQHPASLAALRREVDDLPERALLDATSIKKLPFTCAVVDETLRLYPAAWSFGRAPTRDDVVDGCTLPAGRLVMVVPWATHRDRSLFPQPEAFDPDRFAAGPPPPFAYLPFGAGARTCIGQAFARAEAVIVLATWIGALDFELCAGQDLRPVPLITLRPASGLSFHVRRRAPRSAS